MCSADKTNAWMLCPQCDLMVKLPAIPVGSRASCPRCHTSLTVNWSEPRKRPTGYALAALFMLVLANLFPFITMKVAGLSSQISLMQIPRDGGRRLRQPGHTVPVVCPGIPAFCMITIVLLVNQVKMPVSLKLGLARILFHMRNWGMAEIFMAGCWLVSSSSWPMAKLASKPASGPGVCFVFATARVSVPGSPLAVGSY